MILSRRQMEFAGALLNLNRLAEEAGGAVLAVTLDKDAHKALAAEDVEKCPCCGGERVVARMAGIEIKNGGPEVTGGFNKALECWLKSPK